MECQVPDSNYRAGENERRGNKSQCDDDRTCDQVTYVVTHLMWCVCTIIALLHRNSELILNVLSLMTSSSSLPSLSKGQQQQQQHRSPLGSLSDRLQLRLSEREAVKHIDHLLHLSSSAVVASLVERWHKLAQAIRN